MKKLQPWIIVKVPENNRAYVYGDFATKKEAELYLKTWLNNREYGIFHR